MINISVSEKSGMIYVSVWGHSGKRGESLACAGMSTLFAALKVSVTDVKEEAARPGYGYIHCSDNIGNRSKAHMFLEGVKLLQEKFPEEFYLHT